MLNAISFLAVLVALLAMRLAPRTVEAPSSHVLHGVGEGVAYAFRSMPIRTVLAVVAMVGLVGTPLGVLMPVYADKVLGGGPETYGLLLSVSGLGALAGALFLASRKSIVGLSKIDGSDGRAAGRRDRRRRLHARPGSRARPGDADRLRRDHRGSGQQYHPANHRG